MKYTKIVPGYVKQRWDGNVCKWQEFHADAEPEFIDVDGGETPPDHHYPTWMIQPHE